jgi:large subunit ribosomal protein L33
MPKGNRSLISLECTVCKERNYTTTKNRRNTPDKLVIKKYDPKVKGYVDFKEAKIK